MTPLRILMTADTVGGVFSYVVELIRALRSVAHVHLATMGPRPTSEQRALIRSLENATLHESKFDLEWMDEPWQDVVQAGHWLQELEHQVQADVVHLNGFVHGAVSFRAPVLVVGHSCVLSWLAQVEGRDVSWNQLPPGLQRYAHAVRHGLQQADAVVAPSPSMLRWLEKYYGPLPPARVIWNGRRRLGGSSLKEALVFSAGRVWDPAKSLQNLESVAPAVPWPVYLAGPDQAPAGFKNEATAQAGRAPTPGGLRRLGPLPPAILGEWLARASIFVLPARYEPFGLGPLEAALSGCALVLGDIPTLREVWGNAATFVAPEDAAELTHALNRLIRQPELIRERQAAALTRAARYQPELMAAGYVQQYQDLLASQRSACAS